MDFYVIFLVGLMVFAVLMMVLVYWTSRIGEDEDPKKQDDTSGSNNKKFGSK
ncbi:MAG: hypothetical protein KKE17_02330 [Proteobacteria bacterium]|nr:hypothetical protein [Pseudomonadota bacterium]MBU1708818.1 hypothetical protein [Pseudomonadota bacterium]